jgi:hypothetical protein
LVSSAYGVKTGDEVYAERRFDLRVEQIFRMGYTAESTNEIGYAAILSGGSYVFVTRASAKELLSARICKGDGAKHDQICKNYREAVETRKQNKRFECKVDGGVVKIDLTKKSLVYPGGKVSEGRAMTADITEWNAYLPEFKSENGQPAKVRVRFDLVVFNYLFLMVDGKNASEITSCMPEGAAN